jgi:hypothetical protein
MRTSGTRFYRCRRTSGSWKQPIAREGIEATVSIVRIGGVFGRNSRYMVTDAGISLRQRGVGGRGPSKMENPWGFTRVKVQLSCQLSF